MGFLKDLFKSHLETDRALLRGADKLRRDLFHPKDQEAKPSPPAQESRGCRRTRSVHHEHLGRSGWDNCQPSPKCGAVVISITHPNREGLSCLPNWRCSGFDWQEMLRCSTR
jgi:hypothetical protein